MLKTFIQKALTSQTRFLPRILTYHQFRLAYGPRPAETPTNRGELAPFTQNNLWDNPQAIKKKKRLGRGRASGRGKTSTRGHKGQGQRGTKRAVGFEGGQTPLQKRLPKYGQRKTRMPFEYISLSKIIQYVRKGF